ncbi:MAG: hypothetical protein H2174_03345 [Vampirovibrio sp.]|nr:hypothetical protein [Vampirovibrio sp.]
MMTSINRTYTPSFETTNPSTGKYTTPKKYNETDGTGLQDRKLATLLHDKFTSFAGSDNILTVKEVADLLKDDRKALNAKLEELKVKKEDISDVQFAFDRFAIQQRNIVLAITNETGYKNRFDGVTREDIERVDNNLKFLDKTTVDGKPVDEQTKAANRKKGLQHLGNYYATEKIKKWNQDAFMKINDAGDDLTNTLNRLRSKEENTSSTTTSSTTTATTQTPSTTTSRTETPNDDNNDRPAGYNPDDDTSETKGGTNWLPIGIVAALAGVFFLTKK